MKCRSKIINVCKSGLFAGSIFLIFVSLIDLTSQNIIHSESANEKGYELIDIGEAHLWSPQVVTIVCF